MVQVLEMRLQAWEVHEDQVVALGTALDIVAIEVTLAEQRWHCAMSCCRRTHTYTNLK